MSHATFIVAPDKFKGSLSAAAVSRIVARALRNRHPDADVVEIPFADGGEGTIEVAIATGYAPVAVSVSGPLGYPVDATYCRLGETAVIESASAAGLSLLGRPPDPQTAACATSRGVGELIGHALDAGARRLVIGIGGTASTDGGAGLAQALGARLLTCDGTSPLPGGAALGSIVAADLTPVARRLRGVHVVLGADVDSPLTGSAGAAVVYGAQKGADVALIRRLDHALGRWAQVLRAACGRDLEHHRAAGAGGGLALPLVAACSTTVVSGAEVIMGMTDLAKRVSGATAVIIGEGSLDEQSLRGKGPVTLARFAQSSGVDVIAVVGTNRLSPDALASAGIRRVYALDEMEADPRRCMADASRLLERAADRLAREAGLRAVDQVPARSVGEETARHDR